MPDALVVGFLGGCLPAQQGIPRLKLFHRILARDLHEQLQIPVRFTFEDYFRYSECRRGVERLLRTGPPRALVLSLRPQPLLALSKPTIRYVTHDQKPARAVHPAIRRRDLAAWRSDLDRRDLRRPAQPVPAPDALQRFAAEWHLAAGHLLGLASWATKVVIDEVRRASTECQSRGVKLVVLGVPGSPGSPVGHHICRMADRRIWEACRDARVCYLRWFATEDPRGSWLFMEDGLHLNEAGHAHVARLLLSALRDQLDRRQGLSGP